MSKNGSTDAPKQSVRQMFLPSAYDNSNIVSRNCHLWVWPFLFKFYNKPIKVNDLHTCPKSDRSEHLGNKLEQFWDEECAKSKKNNKLPSLLWPIIRMFWLYYLIISVFCVIGHLMPVLQAIYMGRMIDNLEVLSNDYPADDETYWQLRKNLYWNGAGIVITQFLLMVCINPFYYHASKIGMDIRVAICSLIYRKSLRLSKSAFLETTAGQIVNLLSNDANRFDQVTIYIPFIPLGFLGIGLTIYLMWNPLQYTTVWGIAVLLLYIPMQAFMGRGFSKLREAAARLTDERVRLMNEFIPAMRVIKMYTWESSFISLVHEVRKREISKIRRSTYLRAINLALFFVSAKIIVFIIFAIWILEGGRLDARTVFVCMALIAQVRMHVTLMSPLAISTVAEALISIRRMNTFLALPERQDSGGIERSNFLFQGLRGRLLIENLYADYQTLTEKSKKEKNVSVSLSEKMQKSIGSNNSVQNGFALRGICMQLEQEELCVIAGAVGAGKTSVLMAILGEMNIHQGKIGVTGRLSYASQESWTFAGTVQENILFNALFDQQKYDEVIRVCALQRDLELLPYGDQTIIGDRGVTLSGGQRARINLARALYLDADIYLLDDPLSAVDANVAKHIFEQAIRGYLLKKIVLLVTHQLQYAKHADRVLLLKNGNQLAYGGYSALLGQLNSETSFGQYVTTNEPNSQIIEYREPSICSEGMTSFDPLGSSLSLNSQLRIEETSAGLRTNLHEKISETIENNSNVPTPEKAKPLVNPTSSLNAENQALAASAQAYVVYFFSNNGFVVIVVILALFISQTFYCGSDYWLSLWTDTEELRTKYELQNKTDIPSIHPIIEQFTINENVIIFAILQGIQFIFSLFRALVFFILCMRSSVRLHDRLFRSIINAPMSFFDNTPIGQLLNRCSRDMGIIDDILPYTSFDAIGIIVCDIGICIMLGLVNYWILLPLLVLGTLIFLVRKIYVNTARQIKLLEGVTRSPVFSQLSSSLFGLSTIRAFNMQKRFEQRFDLLQDNHTSGWFFYISAARWFLFTMDMLSVVFIGGVTIVMLVFAEYFNGSLIGLVIFSSLLFCSGFQWCMKQWTEVETQMTSVDRVHEYSEIHAEGGLPSESNIPPPVEWPSEGRIEFKDVTLCYASNLPPVLQGLTFTIMPREKIGVVGRTGAGKSSIIAALFRLAECDGSILIDGLDTKSMKLSELRRKLAIIPQEPVIFTGTVRSNLDPFEKHSDERLWDALQEIQLQKQISEMPGGLDTKITDGGTNFSVGQKQLLCLARAMLRGNRILILDEATANCDQRTDELIQKTIRTMFAHCTIFTIAHRLHTIMDSDRVLVLDAGQVKELDSPASLVQQRDSLFYSMVQATGRENARTLQRLALQAQVPLEQSSSDEELLEDDLDIAQDDYLLSNTRL